MGYYPKGNNASVTAQLACGSGSKWVLDGGASRRARSRPSTDTSVTPPDSSPRFETWTFLCKCLILSGIEKGVRYRRPFRPLISHGERRFYESVSVAEDGLFQVLAFPFLHGEARTALRAATSNPIAGLLT